jgi:hypothetical protein
MLNRSLIRGQSAIFTWVLAVAGTLTLASIAKGYGNRAPDSVLEGGPHRTINELAVKRFMNTLRYDDPRRALVEGQRYLLHGPRIMECSPYMEAPKEEDKPLTWDRWVVEGGFTADEPELFNSFRHFYDPLAWNPDPPLPLDKPWRLKDTIEIDGVPYLTDHLKQIGTCLGENVIADAGTWYANVKVNARDWALTGARGDSIYPNHYSWAAGKKYFAEAFSGMSQGKPLTIKQRNRKYAQAWRALGETMHLMADMTCVPHVRNDSHPGLSLPAFTRSMLGTLTEEEKKQPRFSPNLGVLKNDPYELYCSEAFIRRIVGDPVQLSGVPQHAAKVVANVDDPRRLFHLIASFTNRHFVSADTIPFLYRIRGDVSIAVPIQANGCLPYPQPDFSMGEESVKPDRILETSNERLHEERLISAAYAKDGYYYGDLWGKKYKLCHRTWLSFAGWGSPPNAKAITLPCVEDQAQILLPLAVLANANLMDKFVPKLEIKITELDKKEKVLRGEIVHTPYGAFDEPLVYNGDAPRCWVIVDGRHVILNKDKVKIVDNRITADLKDQDLDLSKLVIFEAEIGGFCLASDPYGVPKPTKLNRCGVGYGMFVGGEFTDVANPQRKKHGARIDCGTGDIPITWNGTSFSGSRETDKHGNKVQVSGSFDPYLNTLTSFEVKYYEDSQEEVAPHLVDLYGGEITFWSFRAGGLKATRNDDVTYIRCSVTGEACLEAAKDFKYEEKRRSWIADEKRIVQEHYKLTWFKVLPHSGLTIDFSYEDEKRW